MVTHDEQLQMEVDGPNIQIEMLYSSDPSQCLEAVNTLKNSVIGSNAQKEVVVRMGLIPRLLDILKESDDVRLLVDTVVTLNSLAKGITFNVEAMLTAGALEILLEGTLHPNEEYSSASVRCLRTIYYQHDVAPAELVLKGRYLTHLLHLASGLNVDNQECVSTILTAVCKTGEQQSTLCSHGVIPVLSSHLCSPLYRVQLSAARCLAALCYQNEKVSSIVVTSSFGGRTIPDLMVSMMARDKTIDMQLAAAKCLTYLFRAGALRAESPKILYKALPTLVHLIRPDTELWYRAQAADTLAYLMEVDIELQRIASISDHLIQNLSDLLGCQSLISAGVSSENNGLLSLSSNNNNNGGNGGVRRPPFYKCLNAMQKLSGSNAFGGAGSSSSGSGGSCLSNHYQYPMTAKDNRGIDIPLVTTAKKMEQQVKLQQDLKIAAFKAFAALGANDEDIRKRIIETDSLMDYVVCSLLDPCIQVRLAAVRCLHSLSRSVQQLRTTFQDHNVWQPLMKLLNNASPTGGGFFGKHHSTSGSSSGGASGSGSAAATALDKTQHDDILVVASSTLCNLLLEFSPSKDHILECGAIELLCNMTRRPEAALRLNACWALMNVAFQAEHRLKSQILSTLGTDQIFRLLSDTDVPVMMKTLGLLRNLLSTKQHIDLMMESHGREIMQAVVMTLEGETCADVKEQALCILANIAHGDAAKHFIMDNDDVLRKLLTYIAHSNVKLQIAAVFCVTNLVWREEDGSVQRQKKLQQLGLVKLLESLVTTADSTLLDKVKTALSQFPS